MFVAALCQPTDCPFHDDIVRRHHNRIVSQRCFLSDIDKTKYLMKMLNGHESLTELLLNISRIRFKCCRDITPKAGCHRWRCQGA
jgi:hypothetical protein